MERAIMCPQCNAPLAPERFARSVVCSYCGATVKLDEASISAGIFHKSFRSWNSPESYGFPSWVSIGDRHWALEKCVAQGEISDVYIGQLARWPTELVVVKLLRDRKNLTLFDNEWDALQMLQASEAPGAETFATLIPQPVMRGDIRAGSFIGHRVNIYRWASGFFHTFAEVIQAYPQGIPPRAVIWVWRRILELLSFIHATGMAHGAILPAHLLLQENEHGLRLAGYSTAGRIGQNLLTISENFISIYPPAISSNPRLTTQLDIIMSARCMVAILGGNPANGSMPAAVPTRLAEIVKRVALANLNQTPRHDAWALREELGEIALRVFGQPRFIPISMAS